MRMAQKSTPGTSTASTALEGLRQELEEARDEEELNLLQNQQVQEGLEFYGLAHQEQQILLQRYRHEMVQA